MLDRTRRDLSQEEDMARVADTYNAWRGSEDAGKYEDVPGLSKSTTLEEVRKHLVTYSPRAGTSAPRRRRTTANPSRRA